MTGVALRDQASRWWLPVLLAAVAGQPSVSYLLMGAVNGTWYPAGYWIASGVVVAAAAMWLMAGWNPRWGGWPPVFFASTLATWAVMMISSNMKDNVYLGVVFWLPLAIGMIWAKRPTMSTVVLAADVFAWVLLGGMAAILALELVGVLGHRAPVHSSAYEMRTYWLPISDLLGLPGRWSGPFAHPNLTSPIAVFLVIYGLWCRGATRVVLTGFGAVVLLLTGTRSALGAVVVGVVLLVAGRRGWLDSRRKLLVWGAGVIALTAAVAVWVVVTGQTFEGRVPMWGKWIPLVSGDPLWGIGDPGVTLTIQAGGLPTWAVHGHNIVLEPLVRYGVMAAILVVIAVGSALVITSRDVLRGRNGRNRGIGLALLGGVVVCGMFESIFDWRYLTAQAVLLLLSVLLATGTPGPDEAEATRTPHDA